MKYIFTSLALSILLLSVAGCANTVRGFGQDLSASGHEISKAAS